MAGILNPHWRILFTLTLFSETRSCQTHAKRNAAKDAKHILTNAHMTDGLSEAQDYLAAYGTLQLDPQSSPVTTKTVMWLASCSKLVTAVSALQCIERGLFSLDDPADVSRLLPEWNNPEILAGWKDGKTDLQPAKEQITLRRLLTHTSGVGYDFLDPRLLQWRQSRGEGPLSMQAPITECFTTPLLFEPGTGFTYGAGLDLVGLMIARANNSTLEAYMRKNVFDILGMHDTSFYIQHNDIGKRLMPMTTRGADGSLHDGYDPNASLQALVDPKDEYGGAGLFSTAEDYLKLLKSVLNDDGKLLRPESVEGLFTPCITPESKESLHQVLSIPFVANIMIPGEPHVGTPGAGDWSHAPGGIVSLEKAKGVKGGTLRWGGAPNLTWWIDRAGGTCGFSATQLFPPGETKHAFVPIMFREEMAAMFGKTSE